MLFQLYAIVYRMSLTLTIHYPYSPCSYLLSLYFFFFISCLRDLLLPSQKCSREDDTVILSRYWLILVRIHYYIIHCICYYI